MLLQDANPSSGALAPQWLRARRRFQAVLLWGIQEAHGVVWLLGSNC
jgi:hypothetical protein